LRLRARRRCSGRVVALDNEPIAWDGELALRCDGDDARLHRGRVRGPASVTFNVPVRLSDRDGRLVARTGSAGEPGGAVVLCGGVTLEVRP
jgi:hypothetical protein